MELNQQLEEMIGNTYEYQGQIFTINDIKVNKGVFTFHTDKDSFKFFADEIKESLSEFKLKGSNLMIKQPQIAEMVLQSGNMYSTLQSTLLESISRIQVDPGYIPQAQAVNDTIKSIIDIEKVKIQTVSLMLGK